MADKTALVTLKANVGGFIADMKRAGGAMSVTGKDARKLADDLDYIGNRSMGAGLALGAGLAVIANVYRKYDAALAEFRAITGATNEQVEKMGETAQRMGQMYGISAHEAADGATALAKAGISVKDVLTGGLEGALALSATGSLEVAEAAEVAAIAMHQFGMEGRDIPLVADMLSKGANDAVGDVRDLAWGLRQAGIVAQNFGLDLDETVGTLSAFANQGLIGSDAGTSFKSMLMAISGPSGVARKKMEELGISFYDSNEQFIGIAETADLLAGRFANMSDEQRDFALATLFGQDAVRSANALIREGGDGIREWTKNVNDAGYASELAQGKLDSLNGDLSKLKVAAENAILNGGSGLNELLRGLAQGATDFMTALQGLDPALVSNTLKVGAAAAALLMLVGGVSKGAAALLTMRDHVRDLNGWLGKVEKSGGRTARVLTGIGRGIGVAGMAVAAASIIGPMIAPKAVQATTRTDFNSVLGQRGQSEAMTREQIDQLFAKQWEQSGRGDVVGDPTLSIKSMAEGLERIYDPSVSENFSDLGYSIMFQGDHSTASMMRNTFSEADQSIAGMVQAGDIDAAVKSFRTFNDMAKEQGYTFEQLSALFPGYRSALEQAAVANGETAVSTERLNGLMAGTEIITAQNMSQQERAVAQQDIMTGAIEETGVALDGTIVNMEKFLELLFATGMATMSARDAEASYHEAIREVDDTVKTLIEDYGGLGAALNENRTDFDLSSEAGQLANNTFQGLAQGGMALVEARANQGMGQDKLQATLEGTYNSLIRAAEGMGIEGKAAEDLTRAVMGIPDNVSIDTWMSTEAKRIADSTAESVKALDGMSATITILTDRITQYRSRGTPDGNRAATQLESKIMGSGRAADGGPVVGPGRRREDNLPYLLSNGEFVLSADDVDALGGFHGVESMRRRLHSSPQAYTGAGTSRMPSPAFDYDRMAAATGGGGKPAFSPQMTVMTQDPTAAAKVAMGDMQHMYEVNNL